MMKHPYKLFFSLIFVTSILVVPSVVAATAVKTMPPEINSLPQFERFTSPNEVYDLFGGLPDYNKEKPRAWVAKNCKMVWKEPPPPDRQSQAWYRMATYLLNNSSGRDDDRRTIIRFYEAAARRGHYKAAKDLHIKYTDGTGLEDAAMDRRKAYAWLGFALRQKWDGALEWEAQSYYSPFFILAGYRGVSLALYEMTKYANREMEGKDESAEDNDQIYESLLRCAAQGGHSQAMSDYSTVLSLRALEKAKKNPNEEIDSETVREIWSWMQKTVMAGKEAGKETARSLGALHSSAETDRLSSYLIREAYMQLGDALVNDIYLTFPNLDKVLPLPPAKFTEWKGIYSAMDPDDAKFYQRLESEDPKDSLGNMIDELLQEIREAGLYVSDSYIDGTAAELQLPPARE